MALLAFHIGHLGRKGVSGLGECTKNCGALLGRSTASRSGRRRPSPTCSSCCCRCCWLWRSQWTASDGALGDSSLGCSARPGARRRRRPRNLRGEMGNQGASASSPRNGGRKVWEQGAGVCISISHQRGSFQEQPDDVFAAARRRRGTLLLRGRRAGAAARGEGTAERSTHRLGSGFWLFNSRT